MYVYVNVDSSNVEAFKKEFDTFLEKIPDQPTISGLGRSAESNSLLHQIPQSMLNRKSRKHTYFVDI